jgi:hypothetical protein
MLGGLASLAFGFLAMLARVLVLWLLPNASPNWDSILARPEPLAAGMVISSGTVVGLMDRLRDTSEWVLRKEF